MILPLDLEEEDLQQIVDTFDGFLFTGGPDIHPFYFGEETQAHCGNVCLRRDRMEILLLKLVMKTGKPIFGICRGIQLLNEMCIRDRHYKAQGYRDMKIKIGRTLERSNAPLAYMANQDCAVSVEEDYKRIEAAKQIVGSGKLLVDTNASWDAQTALSFAPELVRLGVAWLEEPIPFEDIEGMKKLNAAVPQLHVIGCELSLIHISIPHLSSYN